ncbi:MAG: iron-sulfur cluster assembly scaffold protein [Patescibacteria group bacterium]
MEIYRDEILDHARHPRNRGKIPNPTHQSRTPNPLCGDLINLELRLEGKPSRVSAVGFEAEACTVSVAAASMLTEKIKGKTEEELSRLGEEELVSWFGGSLTPSRKECALLPLKALREALGK